MSITEQEQEHNTLVERAQEWLDVNYGMNVAKAQKTYKPWSHRWFHVGAPTFMQMKCITIYECVDNPFEYQAQVEIPAVKLWGNLGGVMRAKTRWLRKKFRN